MLKAAALICRRPVHVPLDLPDLLSWLIFAIIGSGLASLPKFAKSSSSRARRFSLELKS